MARSEIRESIALPSGAALNGAAVLVKDRATGNNSTVYAAETGGSTLANPLTSVQGNITGWLENGSYTLTISHPSIQTVTVTYEAVNGANAGGGGGGTLDLTESLELASDTWYAGLYLNPPGVTKTSADFGVGGEESWVWGYGADGILEGVGTDAQVRLIRDGLSAVLRPTGEGEIGVGADSGSAVTLAKRQWVLDQLAALEGGGGTILADGMLYIDITKAPYNCPKNNTGNAAAIAQTAHDAERTKAIALGARGIVLFMPSGAYRWASSLVLDASAGFSASLRGAAADATVIKVVSDLGTDTYAIRWNAEQAARRALISDFTIEGSSSRVIGSAPWNMHGIQMPSKATAERLSISGFNYGLDMNADHGNVLNCNIGGNFYGIYFGKDQNAEADQYIAGCALDGNTMAGIGVRGSNVMGGVTVISTHFGNSPACIYKEAPTGFSAPYANNDMFISGCVFIDCAFESFGNVILYAPSGGRVTGNSFIKCDTAGIQDPNYDLDPGVMSKDYLNVVSEFVDNYIQGGTIFTAQGLVGNTNVTTTSCQRNYMIIPRIDFAFIDGRKIINRMGLRVQDHMGNEAVTSVAGQAVTRRDLLQPHSGNTDEGGSVRPHSGATNTAAIGVAQSDASVSQIFLRYIRGVVETRYTGTAPSANFYVKPSGTGMTTQAANWSDGPLVGKIRTGTQGDGSYIQMEIGL